MAGSATVGLLRVLLTANTAEFDSAMKNASSTAKKWTRELGQIGQQATAVGAALTKALTVPILGLGAGAIKMASDFESSFAGVRKTVDATEEEFQQLSQGLRNLAKDIPVNVNELNKIAEAAGQLGIKTPAILGFTEVMAKLGVTTNLTSEQAATSLARLAAITQMPQDQFDKLGSTIVGLGNNFETTESEIVDFGLRIAGAGRLAGLTEPQILAIGAAMSSIGVEAEAGGTAIQKVLNEMTSAVATSGKALRVFAETAGMTAAQFKDAYERDAAGAFLAFVEGLGQQGKQGIATLDALGLGNERVVRAFISLAGAGSKLSDTLKQANKDWTENTALTKEAEQRFKTFESQMIKLWGQLRDVGITLGTSLLPTFRDLISVASGVAKALGVVAEWFAALPQGVRTTTIALGALLAAIGPVTYAFGQLALGAKTVTALFTAKGIAARALTAIFPVLGTTATAAAAGVTLLKVALAGLGVGAALLALDFLIAKLGNVESAADKAGGALDRLDARGNKVMTLDEAKAAANNAGQLGIGLNLAADAMGRVAGGGGAAGRALSTFASQLSEARGQVAALTAEQRREIEAGDKLGESVDKITAHLRQQFPALDISEEAVRLYVDSLKKGGKTAAEIAEGPFKKFANKVIELKAQLEVAAKEGPAAYKVMLEELGDQFMDVRAKAVMFGKALDEDVAKAAALAAQKIRDAWARNIDNRGDLFVPGGADITTNVGSDQLEREFALQKAAQDNLVTLTQQAEIAKLQAVLDAAKRRHASLRETNAIERQMLELQLRVSIENAQREFMEKAKALDLTTSTGQAAFKAMELAHQQSVANMVANFKAGTAAQVSSMGEFLKTIQTQLGPAILAAFQGGGDVGKTIGGFLGDSIGKSLMGKMGEDGMFAGGLGKVLQGTFGKVFGGALASIIPGLGTLLGGALGDLGGKLIGKLFGGGEHKQVNDLRDKFTEAAGGIHELNVKAQAAGLTLDRFLKAKTVKEYEAAVAELEAAFQRLDEERQRNLESANDLFSEIMEAGRNGIPESLRPTIERFIELGLLTDDQIEKLRGLGEATGPTLAELEDAASTLGSKLEELGPKFAQAKLDQEAAKVHAAITRLIEAGGDWGSTMMASKEELADLVMKAKKGHLTLSESLKPYIEDLIASGNLVDENGNKITDLSGIEWGPAMKTEAEIAREGWDKLLTKIEELIAAITGPLDRSIDKKRTIDVDVEYHDPGFFPKRNDMPTPGMVDDKAGFATGTVGRFGSWFTNFGQSFATKLHGIEAVLRPRDAVPFALSVLDSIAGRMPAVGMSQAMAAAGGPSVVNNFIPVVIPAGSAGDSWKMAREVRRQLPAAIDLNEDGIRDALDHVIDDRLRTYSRG